MALESLNNKSALAHHSLVPTHDSSKPKFSKRSCPLHIINLLGFLISTLIILLFAPPYTTFAEFYNNFLML